MAASLFAFGSQESAESAGLNVNALNAEKIMKPRWYCKLLVKVAHDSWK